MRIKMQRVELLADRVIQSLEDEEMILVFEEDEARAVVRMVFMDEMEKEAELDEKVREILLGYQEYMLKERIPFHQMFRMIKEKLAKEMGIVL